MFLFFDTETTGLPLSCHTISSPEQPHICQLAAVLMDENQNTLAEFCHLVAPAGWVIPEDATRIHGITTDKCARYGARIEDLCGQLSMLVRMAQVCVAHNYAFDSQMIEIESQRGRLETSADLKSRRSYCTMLESMNICRLPARRGLGYKWPSLAEAHQILLGRSFSGAHDALSDARACARVFFELKKIKGL